jgi:hypothetical protein
VAATQAGCSRSEPAHAVSSPPAPPNPPTPTGIAAPPPSAAAPASAHASSLPTDAGSSPCTGSHVDLDSALNDPACAASFDDRPSFDVYEKSLAIKITPSVSPIPRGGRVDFDVAFVNKGTGPVPLLFMEGNAPRIEVHLGVEDGAGRNATMNVLGTCAAPEVAHEYFPKTARVVLQPGAEGHARATWQAIVYRFGNVDPDPMVGGCKTLPAGPAASGTYRFTFVVSLWVKDASGDPRAAQSWPPHYPVISVPVGP